MTMFNKEERTYWIENYKNFRLQTSPMPWTISDSAPEL